MPEPESDHLFDFDFEKSDTPLYTDLTKKDVRCVLDDVHGEPLLEK